MKKLRIILSVFIISLLTFNVTAQTVKQDSIVDHNIHTYKMHMGEDYQYYSKKATNNFIASGVIAAGSAIISTTLIKMEYNDNIDSDGSYQAAGIAVAAIGGVVSSIFLIRGYIDLNKANQKIEWQVDSKKVTIAYVF